MNRRPFRMAVSVLLAGAVSAVSLGTVGAASAAAQNRARVVPGSLTHVGTIPNYFYSHYSSGNTATSSSQDIQLLADQRSHLLIELSARAGCTDTFHSGAVYNVDTGKLVGSGCVNGLSAAMQPKIGSGVVVTTSNTQTSIAAVDETDHLLFVPTG